MQDSSADTADGGAVVAGAVGGTASETPSYWRVTTGEGTMRVDHSKTESGKTVFTGRVTLHNPSEIPDNYVIFINGEQASKADVLRLAPQKIKRMEVLRGKEAGQGIRCRQRGRNQDYDAQIAAGNRRQPEGDGLPG